MIVLLLALAVQTPHFALAVDSTRRQVTMTLGPYDLPSEPDMPMMDMQSMEDHSPRFVWPADMSLRAYRIRVTDAQGKVLPSRDRVFGGGEETGDVSLPAGIAVHVRGGDDVGFYFMWHNESGVELKDVTLTVSLTWTPANLRPAPVLVVPFWVDVSFHAGDDNTFAAPPGGVVKSCVFSFPVSGHLLAASAHLHAWGSVVRLEDSSSGRVIADIGVDRAPNGDVRKISREVFGIWGMGPHLEAGRRYRLVAVYDNPTDTTLSGLMGLLGGLFAPDHPEQWPVLDRSDGAYQQDLRGFLMADRSRPTPIAMTEVR